MTREETAVIEQSAIAHKNYEDLLTAKMGELANTFVIAKLLYENHEGGFWKVLGHDSFESFLAQPELKIKQSKAYNLIGIYKLYCQELCVPADRLLKAGTSNLVRLMRKDAIDLVRGDKEEWISKAESLSKSDFADEIAEAVGSTPLSPPASRPRPSSPEHWVCVTCGSSECERHHFPVTRGAGGKEVEDWWIPLCRKCHTEYHLKPKDWTWDNKRAWAKYYYERISRD